MRIFFLIPPILLCLATMDSCVKNTEETLKLSHKEHVVNKINLSDSVRVSFWIKNRSDDTVSFWLLPECDCTTVSVNDVSLPPHNKISIDASVKIDRLGDFQKYIFVQMAKTEEFHTIEIRGTAVE